MTTPTTRIEVVRATAGTGSPCLRAIDEHGIWHASAVLVDGRWHLVSYQPGTPHGGAACSSEADAREWVQWLGETAAKAMTAGSAPWPVRYRP